MKPAVRCVRPSRLAIGALLAALVIFLPLGVRTAGQDKDKEREKGSPAEKADKKPAAAEATPGAVEVHFNDDSTLKLTLRDERIELNTPYGKLLIPVRDIRKIEVGWRLPEDVARRIESAIADLGKSDYKRRETASATLLELKEKAYPALLKAEKHTDPEVVRRARELLDQVRAAVPAERLEFRPHDVVSTEDSKIAGRIVKATLKVNTVQFGEQQLKLADVRTLFALGVEDEQPANAQPDPGNLSLFQGQVGKTFAFTVTGGGAAVPPPGVPFGMVGFGWGGNVWGTDPYTLDSSLAAAAVHAGVLKAGQTGVVRVTILGPQVAFQGSQRHGVTSMPYGPFNGAFRFIKGRRRAGP